MKNVCHKIADFLKWVIGVALAICLFAGGLGFFVYIIALCMGGEKAGEICTWLYEVYYGWLIKIGTVTTVLTFLKMYFGGEAKWKNPFNRKSEKNA